jgi:hypothetical protein
MRRKVVHVSSRDYAAFVLAIAAGAYAGFIELHTTEVSATLITVLIVSSLLGFGNPRWFALWAAIVGLSVPASYGVAALIGVTPTSWPEPPGLGTYLFMGAVTLATAAAAGAAGALLSRAAR